LIECFEKPSDFDIRLKTVVCKEWPEIPWRRLERFEIPKSQKKWEANWAS
jgi:hypothetical protein